MPQDPFSLSPGDAEEPDGSGLPAAEETGPEDDWAGPADDGPGMGQGLYVCLPAEQVTSAGFAQGGEADTMAPGPLLGTIVHTVTGQDGTGLAGCSDDQLMGIVSASRRMQSRSAWTEMVAMAEFAARHPGTQLEDQFAADELAAELHLTPLSAAEQMHYASTVARRLPETFAALAAGRIHPVHIRIIEDETRVLTDEDAAQADAILAGAAAGMTFGELRHAAHKLVLQLDPEAAKKRKEAARGEAHVRRFREHSGNAGMVARELPSDEVLASWQHVEQRALDLRAAGVPGTLQELRVRAYLDLLQERDSRDRPAGDQASVPDRSAPDGRSSGLPDPDAAPEGPGSAGGDGDPGNGPGSAGGDGDPGNGPGSAGGDGDPGNRPGGPGGPRRNGPGGLASAAGPSVAALVTLTIPLATWQGRSEAPGEADGFGPLDGDDARDLAAAAARHSRTRWCVTVVNPDGTAAAHGCLPGRHPPPGLASPAVASDPSLPSAGPPLFPPGPDIPMIPVARGPCDHARAETGYHHSRRLTHLIRARNGRCTAPGCSRPAARCDLDHTRPWDQGGPTCECNLAPLCRHHHRCKQAEGWQLTQPEPGVLVWRTPSGRSYVTTPSVYQA
jgi:hypothetical protein